MISPQVGIVSPPTTSKTRQLHVVHLIESLGPGGAERLLHTNLKHFDPDRVRSTVITVYPHATHWREPITELGVPVVPLNCTSTRDIPKGIRTLRTWLLANQPDLIHSHLWAANIIGRVAGRLTGIPVISSVHNPDHEAEAWADGADVSVMKRKIVRALDRWTARAGNDRLIAVSDYVKRSANRHLRVSMDSIDLVYNPIDVDHLQSAPKMSRAELLRSLGFSSDSLILLNVARVSPQKGLVYALRALPLILQRYPSTQLVSVGATTDPAWLEQLQREATALGITDHFHILGSRRDVIEFLRACDVFIFPSLYEGLGIALIEAMAAGCACVATSAGPIPEVVRNGENGILVPPADPEAIAAAVCRVLADESLRARLGDSATKTAFSRFQPQKSADTLTRIYESVVAAKKDKSHK
ncbi:MAG TPA: glycosyltransferase family 4 protein [Pyrinomonadaceae bacterium]|nr:glycosyltransferase family 4 protein [Pyrinomonadaceae bacterium]